MSSYTPRFTIEKADLADALRGLRKVVCTKSTLPVLGCVRVSHQGGRRTLAASSLDQTFVAMPLRRSEPPAVAPTTTKPVMVPVTVATPATP